ncbi:MAG TPA: hypothetical protein VFN90_01115 [Gemmatimonadales bacterium]|nr:hypothetical protein [Gemmatimonadales bacterium]
MLARIGRALLRIAGWLLTPFAATLAAALGATITAMVAPTLSPTAGVAVAFAGGLAGAGLGLWLWVRILRGSPELRDVLAVTAEGVPTQSALDDILGADATPPDQETPPQ